MRGRQASRRHVVPPAEIKQSRTGYKSSLVNTQDGNHLILIDALVACYGFDDSIKGADSQTAVIRNSNALMPWAFGRAGL